MTSKLRKSKEPQTCGIRKKKSKKKQETEDCNQTDIYDQRKRIELKERGSDPGFRPELKKIPKFYSDHKPRTKSPSKEKEKILSSSENTPKTPTKSEKSSEKSGHSKSEKKKKRPKRKSESDRESKHKTMPLPNDIVSIPPNTKSNHKRGGSADNESEKNNKVFSDTEQIRIKCIFGDDKRFVWVKKSVSVQSLKIAISDKYGFQVSQLKYCDPVDKDLITISNVDDLELFFKCENPSLFIRPPSKHSSSSLVVQDISVSLSKKLNHYLIDMSEIKMCNEKPLGQGFFGEVRLGIWRGAEVACKRVFDISFKNLSDVDLFIREVSVISSLRHPNIVQFLGVVLDKDKIIVTEYMKRGSLHDYLGKKKVSLHRLIKIASDIASGMTHLHKEGIIHRDLTSRNILLTEDLSAKVSDFGLSRNTDGPSISSTMGSLPWMGPEVIKNAKNFTKSSDVYSYGMVLWELATRKNPCPKDTTTFNMATRVVNEGWRPVIPSDCPVKLVGLIKVCWNQDPDLRPNFEQILVLLDLVLEDKKIPLTHAFNLSSESSASTTESDVMPAKPIPSHVNYV